MCYNCGCGQVNNEMGDSRNITNKTIEQAAKAAGISPKEAMKNMVDTLNKELRKQEKKTA